MKKTIAIALAAIALASFGALAIKTLTTFGSQQTQADETKARYEKAVQIAEEYKAKAERFKQDIERFKQEIKRQEIEMAEARARHIAEVHRARAEIKKIEIERAGRMNSDKLQAERKSLYERIEEKNCNLRQSFEADRARRKASLAAKVAAKNKRRVEILTSETQQLKEELYKTQMELAKSRSRVEHLSEQLRGMPKSLGRGTSSGPARRRK